MKSALFSVRQAASAGTSINPPIRSGAAGLIPSQSQPRLITLPSVLIAIPRSVSASGVGTAAPGSRHHRVAQEQPELDPNAGEADPLASGLGARRDVVIAGEIAPLHPAAVVHDREPAGRRIGREPHGAGTRIERVGDD